LKKNHWGCNQIGTNYSQTVIDNFYFFRIPLTYEKCCNEIMKSWCIEHRIEIQMTIPYSLSQNGIAEWMNHMLVELSCVMICVPELPKFLWESAVAHTAYLHNRSYSRSVAYAIPYQRWHNHKPDVLHLREFGSNIWILSEGPNISRKMLPKAIEQIFVGYDDGAYTVKYYNKDTQKILISCNF